MMLAAKIYIIHLIAETEVCTDAELERISIEIEEIKTDISEDIEVAEPIFDCKTSVRTKVETDAPVTLIRCAASICTMAGIAARRAATRRIRSFFFM